MSQSPGSGQCSKTGESLCSWSRVAKSCLLWLASKSKIAPYLVWNFWIKEDDNALSWSTLWGNVYEVLLQQWFMLGLMYSLSSHSSLLIIFLYFHRDLSTAIKKELVCITFLSQSHATCTSVVSSEKLQHRQAFSNVSLQHPFLLINHWTQTLIHGAWIV